MRKKSNNDKLRAALRKAWQLEQEQLNKEVEDMGPHVFSEEFNQKMDKLLNEMAVKEKRGRRKDFIIRACAIVATFVLLVTGATTFASVNARASASGMNVIEWCEKYFFTRVESNNSINVTFDESKVTYIPEGFENVQEERSSSDVYLKYEKEDKYFIIHVQGNNSLLGVDTENGENNILISSKGIEYRLAYKAETNEYVLTWISTIGERYTLTSLLENEENVKIIDGIEY